MTRFAIRTVRNGQVKINGRTYTPDETHMKHDGRLNGHRFAFGLYEGKPGLISLWGTEEAYRGDLSVRDYTGQHRMPDGGLPWIFWHEAG